MSTAVAVLLSLSIVVVTASEASKDFQSTWTDRHSKPFLSSSTRTADDILDDHEALAYGLSQRLSNYRRQGKFPKRMEQVGKEEQKKNVEEYLLTGKTQLPKHRGLLRVLEDEEDDEDYFMCDAALTQCLQLDKCMDCFTEFAEANIDWATIPVNLECKELLGFIYDNGHCSTLALDTEAESVFCTSFKACVQPDRSKLHPTHGNATMMDCNRLETCDWDGIHKQFLGDGICHENMAGCYNSAVCGWDNGDCCPDTCKADPSLVHCGLEGYACRDPQSFNCNSDLSTSCGENENWVDDSDDLYIDDDRFHEVAECDEGDGDPYRLIMYDSFGDGWEETTLKVIKKGDSKDTTDPVFDGALNYGSQGTTKICLSSTPACYTVITKGGIWGKEVSWEIKPMSSGGAPAIASGGSPVECDFAVAGTACETTCRGRTTVDPTTDPEYREFKALYQCVLDRCPLQVAVCNDNDTCKTCLEAEDLTPDFCFGNNNFNAVVDCALCSCTDDNKSEYCKNRDGTSSGKGEKKASDNGNADYAICSPTQTMLGGNAIIAFSDCTDFDAVSMLLMDFDQNHFGDLDTFEACAHEYNGKPKHGGHTAMECMGILGRAKDGMSRVEVEDPKLKVAIQALAGVLYDDGKEFCDCALQANKDCPLCSSFLNFKTLLYESVDACSALDEIDCAAWSEFYLPCRNSVEKQFTKADFTDSKQCDFVHSGCGGVGTFPSFRRLDCDEKNEVTKESWTFYQSFAKNCLTDDGSKSGDKDSGKTPTPSPVKPATPAPQQGEPAKPPTNPPDAPTPPYKPSASGSGPARKPYVPPEKRDKNNEPLSPSSPSDSDTRSSNADTSSGEAEQQQDAPAVGTPETKKQSHFWRNFFLVLLFGAGGYIYYKVYGLTLDGFEGIINFVGRLIRRLRGGGGSGSRYDGDAMYTGLAMESSTSFEPAFLPPAPSAVDHNQGGNGNYYI
ncbi:hypothetical protein ACA910_003932 [Epithemia clementina (nom. ined.)]